MRTKCGCCGHEQYVCAMCGGSFDDVVSVSGEWNDSDYTTNYIENVCALCFEKVRELILDSGATNAAYVGYMENANGCPKTCGYARITAGDDGNDYYRCEGHAHSCRLEKDRQQP